MAIEYKIKNLYEQVPTEEQCTQSAIAMAKAMLSLGIDIDKNERLLRKLEPEILTPDIITQNIPRIIPSILPLNTVDNNPPPKVNSSFKRIGGVFGRFLSNTIKSIYGEE